MKRYWADCRVDLRVYFIDNEEDQLADQAVENLDSYFTLRDGECEDNSIEVLRIEEILP